MIKFNLIFYCVLILILNSCSRQELLSPIFSTSVTSYMSFFSDNDETFNRSVIDNIPYASALLSFDGQKKSLIILQSITDSTNYWVSSDRVIFKEKQGRLIGTFGLPNDLYHIDRPEFNFSLILNNKKNYQHVSYYSFRNPELNNLKVESEYKYIEKQIIEILGIKKELILVQEEIYSERINWKATNSYWLEPNTHFIWKSIQHISPRLPVINIEITKKPAI